MKRIISVFLIIFLVTMAGVSAVYAENDAVNTSAEGRGRLEAITYSAEDIYEVVNISASKFADYHITELSDPLRIVIDIIELTVPEKQGIIPTDGSLVNRIRYSQFTERITRVVLDVNEGYDYSIVRTEAGLHMYMEA